MIEAENMCMTMRGIKKTGSKTITIATRGIFEEENYQTKFLRTVKMYD